MHSYEPLWTDDGVWQCGSKGSSIDTLPFPASERRGIRLLDAMVFTDDFRWWSLHELTTGTTEWRFKPHRKAR